MNEQTTKLINKMNEQTTKLVSLKNAPNFDTNPFIVELKGKMYLQPKANTIVGKKQAIIDKETGEIDETMLIGTRRVVDKSTFAKIYASEIGILFSLSKNGINIFLHFAKIMDWQNKVIFDYMREYKKVGYNSSNSALKGIRELITNNIIACHNVTHIYWINPTIMCKGERFQIYTEYITSDYALKQGYINEEFRNQIENKKEALDGETREKLEKAEKKTPLFN